MRSKNYRSFKILVILSFILTAGIIVENVHYVLNPKSAALVINVEKVKEEINNAGLKPVVAKHWKKL